MNRSPIIPIVVAFIAALVVTDAFVFKGQSSRTIWEEAKSQVYTLNAEVRSLLKNARQ